MKASLPSTAVRLGCSFLTSISGRAPSGYAVCSSSITTSRDSGRNSAITCTAIRGENNDMLASDRPVVGPKRLRWQTAEVREVIAETPLVKSLVLHVADWPGHLPGQHCVPARRTAWPASTVVTAKRLQQWKPRVKRRRANRRLSGLLHRHDDRPPRAGYRVGVEGRAGDGSGCWREDRTGAYERRGTTEQPRRLLS